MVRSAGDLHLWLSRGAGRLCRVLVAPVINVTPLMGSNLIIVVFAVVVFVVLAIAAAGFALIVRTVHSPFGQVLRAIKENEPRAISLGYDVERYKLLAFVLSAVLAGLAGALKAVVLGFATLTDVHWTMSGLVILMTLVGGMAPWPGLSSAYLSSSPSKTSWETSGTSWPGRPM